MGNYVSTGSGHAPTPNEAETLRRLSRGGRRLVGFSRTQLFKRLESGGVAFVQSRHLLRNFVVLHAIEHDSAIPVGTQTAEVLDVQASDEDVEEVHRLLPDEHVVVQKRRSGIVLLLPRDVGPLEAETERRFYRRFEKRLRLSVSPG
jgi:hypothetical protein